MPVSLALMIVAGVLAVAVAAGLIWRALDGRRRPVRGAPTLLDELDADAARAVLLLFSTQTCARCPQVRRMLHSVASALVGIEATEIDLTHRADLAARHRILTTPTTFIVTPVGTVAARFTGAPRRVDIEAALAELPAPQEVR
ncbi:thioredoxin domain-containing protein [Microbacterium sp. NPDC058345]|uniref:thioredoxin domain-containing protein n=1 Tax=Microbacterium sp. NPDC058345 TaxID=3346455 RepID=UPI003668ED0F